MGPMHLQDLRLTANGKMLNVLSPLQERTWYLIGKAAVVQRNVKRAEKPDILDENVLRSNDADIRKQIDDIQIQFERCRDIVRILACDCRSFLHSLCVIRDVDRE